MADDRRTCFAVFGCLWGPNDVSERVRLCLVVVASVLPMDLLRQDLGGVQGFNMHGFLTTCDRSTSKNVRTMRV